MAKVIISELPKTAQIEVLGHTFQNLQEVRDAVSIIGHSHADWNGNRYIREEQPSKPVLGLYVGLIYEPYPCFDSSDYAYEKRRYWNYFFSDSPITAEDLTRLAEMLHKSNYRYIHEEMEGFAAPALYWGGDSTDNLLLTTLEEES